MGKKGNKSGTVGLRRSKRLQRKREKDEEFDETQFQSLDSLQDQDHAMLFSTSRMPDSNFDALSSRISLIIADAIADQFGKLPSAISALVKPDSGATGLAPSQSEAPVSSMSVNNADTIKSAQWTQAPWPPSGLKPKSVAVAESTGARWRSRRCGSVSHKAKLFCLGRSKVSAALSVWWRSRRCGSVSHKS